MFHLPDLPDRLDECTDTTDGPLELVMEPASTGPIWNDDTCEPDGVRNANGVLISYLRLLAELVVEPPKDGPS